ncbi:hypothetical protein ACGFIV_16765 [Sphaerisporangium sp. NPDC049003]|uniref:hypothetical protein n=1 Tax=Sphaerisporangium sp. NPDC049003 TaxID=3364517 RepID=UPI003719CDB6
MRGLLKVVGVTLTSGLAGYGAYSIADDYLSPMLYGHPDSVYIASLGKDVEPKSFIEKNCVHSVIGVKALEESSIEIKGDSDIYQRWTVIPKPGHIDRVLMSTVSGKVICP